jgi:hypothetical protein
MSTTVDKIRRHVRDDRPEDRVDDGHQDRHLDRQDEGLFRTDLRERVPERADPSPEALGDDRRQRQHDHEPQIEEGDPAEPVPAGERPQA